MEKQDIFKQFLDRNEVLIVDKNPGSRSRLIKTLSDMGAQRHMIHTSGHLNDAQEIVKTKNIGIVLSEYFIGGGSGFDLFKTIREKHPKNKELCLVLVTSNISQTAVAKAAEEDVDSFIIKPYSIQTIQENLIATVAAKVRPSAYILKIEEGKKLLASGKYDDAIVILNEAIPLHPRPALALFYIGQGEYLKELAENATNSYNKGLSFNNIHYKCLVGLYEIFMRQNKFDEAYQVVKKIAKYFPANPDRLTQIVRLAIQTKNYADMQMYYEIFKSFDVRTSNVTNYLGAGMYVCGKHFLLNGDYDMAMRYFDNVAVSCSEFTKLIRGIVSLLVEHDNGMEAMKYLGRFPPGSDMQEDFLVSNYLVTSKTINDVHLLIRSGLDLYNRGIRDYQCIKTLVEAMQKEEFRSEKILPFIHEMNKLWPQKSIATI